MPVANATALVNARTCQFGVRSRTIAPPSPLERRSTRHRLPNHAKPMPNAAPLTVKHMDSEEVENQRGILAKTLESFAGEGANL